MKFASVDFPVLGDGYAPDRCSMGLRSSVFHLIYCATWYPILMLDPLRSYNKKGKCFTDSVLDLKCRKCLFENFSKGLYLECNNSNSK